MHYLHHPKRNIYEYQNEANFGTNCFYIKETLTLISPNRKKKKKKKGKIFLII